MMFWLFLLAQHVAVLSGQQSGFLPLHSATAYPVPNITFTTATGRSLGESLTFNCTVDVLDGLYNINVNISIKKNERLVASATGTGDTTAMITIDSLRVSDAGDYQCIVNITQPDIDYEFNGIESTKVILTLPTPSVVVEYNATRHLVDGKLAEGQFLDIICIADISQYIDTSVSITMSWRRDNTVLTNGSDFTISPPVMTNNQYIGVLHINSLRDERDNGASYNCSVSVTPNTPFIIAGNDNSSAVTFTVARFDINHVDISICIPSVPVAGDLFNLSCVIVVPPNFVKSLTSVRWTCDLEASQDVTSENNDATLVPVVRNGNIFTSVLMLDPVKTTDARRYYCQATILVFGSVDRTDKDISVQISSPSVSIVADPPTGPIYESTGYSLTCTARVNTTIVNTPVTASVVWTDPRGNVIPTNDARRQVIPPTGDNNYFVSMLLFQPIDTGRNNDEGTYTCQMIIDSGNSLIASSQPTNATLAVTLESLPLMTVNFSSVGSIEVGQSLTITCTIETVERLVVTPLITFMKMNDTEVLPNLNMQYTITTDDTGSITNYTLILDPVRFEDAGMYACMAEFNVTGFNNTNDPNTATYDYQEASDVFNLILDFPPVVVTMSKEHDDRLYAGTSFFIKCDILLDPLVTIPVTVTNQWTRDDTNVPMGSSDATITESLNVISALHFSATLMFYPLDNADDSGMYTCNVEVTAPNSYIYIKNPSSNANITITVIATPRPAVEIVTMGMAKLGEEYMLNCTVTVVDRLIVSPIMLWTKKSANNVISIPPVLKNVSKVKSSLNLIFRSLNTSDAGLYTCEASINVIQISVVTRSNEFSSIVLQIPIPFANISQSRISNFLAGSNLILTCDISVDPNVDTPFTVNLTWNMTDQQIMNNSDMGNNGHPDSMMLADTDRVNISSIKMRSGFNEYKSTVNFTTLSSTEDSGTYTCIVTIVPAIAYEYQYVMTSDTIYVNSSFTVTDLTIGGLSASPDSFLGLETSCLDSNPYDNFTLTCTATKPTIVIPNLVVAWTHNGTIVTGAVTTTHMVENTTTTTVTNALSFSNSRSSDSGTYRCTASIAIPDSTNITTNEESTVTIRSQSLPVPATNVTATPGATTAALSFIIPNIAYTPETYSVKYTGAILQTTEATSIIKKSSSNISAINTEFMIMLTGLEEDNTYAYTVDSINCLGTTSTAEMSFRTLPTLPAASPMDCANITFLPSNVTLTWIAPALRDQNGAPVGYNLTCINNNGVSVNKLNATQTSMSTSFTITDVMPFTAYTCDLSFINVIGQGPSTQCTFQTARNLSYDSPKNFTSIPDQKSVLFSWMKPTSTNRVIISYNLTVTNLDESKLVTFIIELNSDERKTHKIVDGFSPYQNYTASVSASTINGAGPVAITEGRTLPDLPSSPHLIVTPVAINGLTIAYTVPVLNETTINVTWSPPSHPNGDITGFIVRIATDAITSSNNVAFAHGKALYTLIYGGLKARVPYYISVVAVNQVGVKNSATAIAFTKADSSVTVSPSNVQAMRIGDTIVLSWDPVTLEEAKGFFVYSIRLTPHDGSSSSASRQTNTRTTSAAYDTTSVNITDTKPQLAYTVSISVLLLTHVGLIEGPAFYISLTMSPTDGGSTDQGDAVLTIVMVVSMLIIILLLVVVCIIIVALHRKKFKKCKISRTNEGYSLMAITHASVAQNNVERINEYLYEPTNDEAVLQEEEETPVVGDSVDVIPIASCSPVYDTSPITGPDPSLNQGENERRENEEYENML
ncbi:PREDICTED: neural cell adhesion molecule L1-like [Amphimedon queenslandica]|uniref:Protein-tyrosine-phosphatase n=1 Tax=Amphimedon queenslandica TaxID=400682 RepID=A0AAN0JB45_AMPQE|nr:PREDICTED: neural cell adhesion molecule L1-like [Amphimedon queenslandica]|eukprot:XP_019853966.1 PREDICTED: neural cell adhesion molecule L1-like [Amphimedon queenslandica]